MPRSVRHYDRLRNIGEGTYAMVYKARNSKKTNEYVALKKIYIENDEEGIPSTAIREIAIGKELKHPNIILLLDVILENSDLYLVFEICTYDLKKHLNKYQNKLTLVQKKSYLFQILSATAFCHSRRILHRDLKPQNILINEKTDQIKIADFGLARTYTLPQKPLTHEVITLWYRPPEILLGCKTYSIAVDIWSIGCIAAEIINNSKTLFRGDSEISQILQIFRGCGTPNVENMNWPNVEKDCKNFQNKFPKWKSKPIGCLFPTLKPSGLDLMKQMIVLDPFKRITPKQALNHKWFTE